MRCGGARAKRGDVGRCHASRSPRGMGRLPAGRESTRYTGHMAEAARTFSHGWQRLVVGLVAVGAIASLLLQGERGDDGASGETVRRTTGIGQRRSVRLDDGTRVELSVQSTVSYPRVFGPEVRALTLTGEA